MPDVKLLGRLIEGQSVHVNGHEYVIDDIQENQDGRWMQITLRSVRKG